MHIQIVTFSLRDISDADYRSACNGLARVLARVPGLIWMAWLADEPFTRAGLYASTEVHAFVNLWPQRAGFPT